MNTTNTELTKVTKLSPAQLIKDVQGGIAIPTLMWFLGVPGIVCILAWALFFRG